MCLFEAEMVSSPIYCFDEFDVFMDAVHRKMIFETLLYTAYDMKSQFMFFTPQVEYSFECK